ncbi:MAG TPA: sigma-70 family RNA polymerase sigma factor [Anaerolineales bacterium]|nr:sigma-70 family RNA polymerase sigma factor [Anaerolineales bacterium]
MKANVALGTNQEWLQALRPVPSAEALEELRAILLRGLRAALADRVDGDVDALSEDFAQEALLRILNSLDTFRGESRFTTWAQKIAIHIALSELRRRRWKDIPLQTFTENADGEELTPAVLTDPQPQPDRIAAQKELLRTVELLVFEELTDRQRTAMLAILQDGIPLQEVAERMDTNPNALYKLLHDARQRLKRRLEETTGLSAQELLATFEGQ